MAELREIILNQDGTITGSPGAVRSYRQTVCNMDVENEAIREIYTKPYLNPEALSQEIREVKDQIEEVKTKLKPLINEDREKIKNKVTLPMLEDKFKHLIRRLEMLKFLKEQMNKTISELEVDYTQLLDQAKVLLKESNEKSQRYRKELGRLIQAQGTLKSFFYSCIGKETLEVREIEPTLKRYERETALKAKEHDNIFLRTKLTRLAWRFRYLNRYK